jgi:hypothetical protein
MIIQNPVQKKTEYQRQLISIIPFTVHTFAAAAQFT